MFYTIPVNSGNYWRVVIPLIAV